MFGNTERTFVTLDGLRGIAAFLIVLRHAGPFFSFPNPFFESYLAVDFFFVLSGFVLTHAYGQKLHGGMSAWNFMKARFVRLYPLYVLALALSALATREQFMQGHMRTTINLAFAIFFLPSPASEALFPLNGPAWSLFFETIANAGFGVAARRYGVRALIIIVFVAALVLTIAVLTRTLGFGSETSTGIMDNGYTWGEFGAGLSRAAFSFFCGVLIYGIWSSRKPRINVSPFFAVAALFAIFAIHPSDNYQVAYDLIAVLGFFPLLVLLGASSQAFGLMARIFALLGTASYGVYVLQVPLFLTSRIVQAKFFGGVVRGWLFGIGFIVLVFIVALLADRYFDRPIRARIMSRLRRPLPTLGPTATPDPRKRM